MLNFISCVHLPSLYSFRWSIFSCLSHFLNGLLLLLRLRLKSSLYILHTSPCQMWFANILSQSLFSSQTLLSTAKVLNFSEFQFTNFSLIDHAFCIIRSKKSSSSFSSQRCSMLSSKSFMVLHFKLQSILKYFYINCELWVKTNFFCLWISNCSHIICWKNYPPLNCFCTFVKDQVAVTTVGSLGSQFCAIDLCMYASINTTQS